MKIFHVAGALALLLSSASGTVFAQHPRLDGALSDLVDSLNRPASAQSTAPAAPHARFSGVLDARGRVLVDLILDGSVPPEVFAQRIRAAGGEVTGINPRFRGGAISAFIPKEQIGPLSTGSGLQLMKMTLRPHRNVGAATSQGAHQIRSDLANASGYTGAGITVGVLSDSYDSSPPSFTTIRAANDIATGDLRVPKFVLDLPPLLSNADEGRAMMQIVQDVAPGADLCFATAFAGEAAFAANIVRLRTEPACRADVIVDDIVYSDEPFFSDGQVAEAIIEATTSVRLPGKKVAYVSATGNFGANGGSGSVDVPFARFSTTPANLGNINLASIANCPTAPATGNTKNNVAGGWLDWGNNNYTLDVLYNSAGAGLIMQWDDLFYQHAVTTDLNFYVFNNAGQCFFSVAANNFATDYAAEFVNVEGGVTGSARIMVGRTNTGSNQATRVRLLNVEGWGGAAFRRVDSPTTFGHTTAANVTSVAAYRYANANIPPGTLFEGYSSPGPATIAFDAAGNRLAVGETRKKPDVAAPDGVDTTFFAPGQDPDRTGRPNFFGTSAAAPHVAGVAALLLQKAGGPGSLTPGQVQTVLQLGTKPRVIPYSGGAPTKAWSPLDGFGVVDAIDSLNKLR